MLVQALLVFVTLATLYSLSYVGIFHSGDEQLFVAGSQSLGAWGEINSGEVYSNRGMESSVEPGVMVLGAALYQFARLPGVGGVHVLFLTNVYVSALTGSVVFLLARQLGCRPGAAVGAALLFGTATLAWPHSKYYFRDPLAMLFVALAAWSFELIFVRQSLRAQIVQWGVTLACVAAGALSKNTAAVTGPVLLVAALVRGAANRAERRASLIGPLMVVAAALLWALVLPAASAEGRFAPFAYLNALRTPLGPQFGPAVLGLLISPGKGLFIESPFLLLALAAPWSGAVGRTGRKWLVPWLMTFALALAVAWFKDYIWWGGVGWGVRHMLPAVPLLAAAAAPALQALWDTRRRWVQLAGGALLLASALVQLGAVMAPPEAFYDRIAPLAPGAAWTLAIWSPRWTEAVGFWQTVLGGQAWDFAWVRLFPYHPLRVAGLVGGLTTVLALSLIILWRFSRAPQRRLAVAAALLTCLAVSIMPYALLRVYYPDPYYHNARTDFRAAADYVAGHARPGDVVVVRGYLHPLWYFFLNYAHSPVPWYVIDGTDPKPAVMAAIQARQSPELALNELTLQLLSQLLPARYGRLWLVNDFGGPGGELRLEEWWLAQNYAYVQTHILYAPGQVAVSLFALSSPSGDLTQSSDFRFGDAIRLKSYGLAPASGRVAYHPGDTLPVSLVWEAMGPVGADYNIGVYLLDGGGVLRAQQDVAPVGGFYPTSAWRPDKPVTDHHAIILPASLRAGDYTLLVAVYDWRTGERLPVAGPDGPSLERLASLRTIRVEAP